MMSGGRPTVSVQPEMLLYISFRPQI